MLSYPDAATTAANNTDKYRVSCTVTRSTKYKHILPVLASLHWLPVKSRIDFKVLHSNRKHHLHSNRSIFVKRDKRYCSAIFTFHTEYSV